MPWPGVIELPTIGDLVEETGVEMFAGKTRADVEIGGSGRVRPSPAAQLPDPHEGLSPLMQAAALCRAKVAVLRVEMHWSPAKPWRWRPLELIAKAFVFLGPHVRLVGTLWRQRNHDLLVVREFLTQVVLLVWPLIWPLRRKVYFLVNHNLQEAHVRRFERICLKILYRSGFRFACLETVEGFAELGILPKPERFLVVPHPLWPLAPPRSPTTDRLPMIGVIGAIRGEKGSEEILSALASLRHAGRLRAQLLLGCPEPSARAVWAERGFEVVDTTDRRNYLAAFDRVDVIVLNYQRSRYYYRPSGVAADALGRRAAVVSHDFPAIRHQLTVPARVGVMFAACEDLESAIAEALALRPGLDEALRRHEEARRPEAIAALIDDFITGPSHVSHF